MTVILDLVNKSLTNVAEMHFIGFVDPENISLDTVDAIHLVYVWVDQFSYSDTFWRHIHLFSSGDTVER